MVAGPAVVAADADREAEGARTLPEAEWGLRQANVFLQKK